MVSKKLSTRVGMKLDIRLDRTHIRSYGVAALNEITVTFVTMLICFLTFQGESTERTNAHQEVTAESL